MTEDQILKWERLLDAHQKIREWAEQNPDGTIDGFLQWQRAEAQRAYAQARRATVGEGKR